MNKKFEGGIWEVYHCFTKVGEVRVTYSPLGMTYYIFMCPKFCSGDPDEKAYPAGNLKFLGETWDFENWFKTSSFGYVDFRYKPPKPEMSHEMDMDYLVENYLDDELGD